MLMKGAALCVLLGATACAERVQMGTPARLHTAPGQWDHLIEDAITEDGVDYDMIEADRATLERYLAWVARHGPNMDNMRESAEDRRMAFVANAYNAAVIFGVLQHRPIESVRDVPYGPVKWRGLGFFKGMQFHVDGDWMDLHTLENQHLVHRYQEPLAHLMLTCASRSCPPLQYWSEEQLQPKLEAALRAYLASDQGMRAIDGGFALSELFDWYADDFLDWSSAADLCEYLAPFAEGERHAFLASRIGQCEIPTIPWDWRLNDGSPGPGEAPRARTDRRARRQPAEAAPDEGVPDDTQMLDEDPLQ